MLWGMGAVTVTTLFFTLGAVGKSAQIPLYIWLPDAMAGPTPVSALIHAATMVTAGIYMIGRLNFLYLMAPATMTVVAVAGTATALVAATIAVTQNDIKKVLAYSTISQLGYMFTAMGVAAFSAGIFHLLTHAFFKALLFLGAGSVIHGMSGKQDMTGMGGLRRLMPLTFWTFLAGTLAITGIPGLSGFFSKDEILWKAFSTSNRLLPHLPFFLWFIGFLVAGLTAFYMFRLLIKTFFGKCRADEGIREHIHESPYAMTVPLAIFAVFSVSAGYVGVPRLLGGLNRFHHFLAPVFGEGADGQVIQHASVSVTAAATVAAAGAGEAAQHGGYALEAALMALSVAMVAAGIFIADLMYRRHPHYPAKLAEKFRGFHRVLINKYYVDEFYHAVFTTSLLKLNRVLAWFDSHVIDGTIRGTAMSTRLLAKVSRAFDDKGVDGIVKGMAEGTISAGGQLRKIQTGRIQTYVYYVLGGIVIIVMVRLVVS
jgi:NADH-quinone oxidoreductase subunit L